MINETERNVRVESRKIDELLLELEKIKKGYSAMDRDFRKLNELFSKSANAERQTVNKLVEHADEEGMRQKLGKWHESVSEKQKSMNQAVKNINDVLIKSGKKYCGLFSDIHSLNKFRLQLIQDIQGLEAKLHKFEYKERSGANIVKVKELKLEIQKLNYNLLQYNSALIEDGEMCISTAKDFFCLPLKSLIASHLELYDNLNEQSRQISQLFNSDVDLMKLGSTPEEHLDNRIREISNELSIVKPSESSID